MQLLPIATTILHPPQEDLLEKIKASPLDPKEGDVVVITSKVVSIWQGRAVDKEGIDKDALIKQEAERYIERDAVPGTNALVTITHGVLGTSAGIDASNSGDYYVLLPEDPFNAAEVLRQWLCDHYYVEKLGVIITDSRSQPLRRGAVGVALAWAGISPLRDIRGTLDLFGRELRVSQVNVVDSLAAAAVFVMGEADEGYPVVVVRDAPHVWEEVPATNRLYTTFNVALNEDLYAPIVARAPWKTADSDEEHGAPGAT